MNIKMFGGEERDIIPAGEAVPLSSRASHSAHSSTHLLSARQWSRELCRVLVGIDNNDLYNVLSCTLYSSVLMLCTVLVGFSLN